MAPAPGIKENLSMPIREVPVPEEMYGERVDIAASKLSGMSRNRIQEILSQGGISLDDTVLQKSDRLSYGWLRIEWQEKAPLEVVPVLIPNMQVLYEDDDLIVVDKPVGVAAHPAPSWDGPTVLGGLAALGVSITTSGAFERQGIVQRLDVGTSGIMVVAKSEISYSVLKDYFRHREVKKIYHAIVQGHPDPMSGTIDAPIGRNPKADWKFAVRHDGRASITHYETLEAFAYATLLEIELETGRTHQIRVHMSAHGHPCVGDPLYGSDPVLSAKLGLERQWLHAKRIEFIHPSSKELVRFESEYPQDLQIAFDKLHNHDFG